MRNGPAINLPGAFFENNKKYDVVIVQTETYTNPIGRLKGICFYFKVGQTFYTCGLDDMKKYKFSTQLDTFFIKL